MSKLKDLKKFAEDHPGQMHPDFDTIVKTMDSLESTHKLILASAEKYPELTDVINDAAGSLKEAQGKLHDAAILSEDIDEGTTAGDNE